MGIYINPGLSGFAEILNSDYVDMTALIDLVNQTIGTTGKLTCVSRPRRFGKSYAAKMLCAYYDCSCASHDLFAKKKITGTKLYEKYLNKFNVIYLDITSFISVVKRKRKSISDVPDMIVRTLHDEICSLFDYLPKDSSLMECILSCVEREKKQFVFIIDEWDAIIREARNDDVAQQAYLNLLREWFKNSNFTPKAVAAAYMTGILPLKKDGTQSAISDFKEYSILYPGKFAQYTGFTENDVRTLCQKYNMPFEKVKSWYDGYDFSDAGAIYNPYSVMRSIEEKECRSFWKETSAAESLKTYINMDFDGMQKVIVELIMGEEKNIDVSDFQNDFETFNNRDDVLTLLIHLGYLTFNKDECTVRIPNEEVRSEFRGILKGKGVNAKWMELIKRSRKLLDETLAGNGGAVASILEEIRLENYAPQFYNNEQSLRSVIKFGYLAACDDYIKMEEVPSGKGIADVIMIPKRLSVLPALVIELKWDKSSGGAIEQIKDRNYPSVLKEFGGEILLVGVNYNSQTGEHACLIERMKS